MDDPARIGNRADRRQFIKAHPRGSSNYRRVKMKIKYIFVMLVLLLGTQAFAQVDPTKVLIGTWDGFGPVSRNQEWTLVITSLKPTGDGAWTGQGRFGHTGQIDTQKDG